MSFNLNVTHNKRCPECAKPIPVPCWKRCEKCGKGAYYKSITGCRNCGKNIKNKNPLVKYCGVTCKKASHALRVRVKKMKEEGRELSKQLSTKE